MPAELPLVPSAMALAISALLFFVPHPRWRSHRAGILFAVAAAALPVALEPFIDPLRSRGRALWEWSAVGGPSIRASYDLDALAALTLALAIAFTGATLATAGRAERRHPALAALVLAIGLVTIALVVTADLVAAIVVLAVLAALTVLALFAVAPASATARAAGYLSIGLQAWVLAALLVSRSGSPTFLLDDMPSTAVTAGAVLAATVGALLFAGLYPVVAWSVDGSADGDPGPLGSLILMPAGIGATLLLLRVVAASHIAPTQIGLPEIGMEARLAAVVLLLLAVALRLAVGAGVPRRPIVVSAVVVALVAAYPLLGWTHVLLFAAILSILYGGAVSLAMPDRWNTVRADLGLVALWIALATGSPLAIAGGMVALLARAGAALASSLWLVPHRDYFTFLGGSTVFIAGTIVVGVGAADGTDAATAALAAGAAALLVTLEIAQVGRRYRDADVPHGLDVASGLAAFLLALFASLVVIPVESVVRDRVGGPSTVTAAHVALIAASSATLVALARTVRPLLPYFERAAERAGPTMRALDPVPIAVGAFRGLEIAATRGNATFALFEQRAGVWLATAVIVALLVWAVR